jgi:hypothetical protein
MLIEMQYKINICRKKAHCKKTVSTVIKRTRNKNYFCCGLAKNVIQEKRLEM